FSLTSSPVSAPDLFLSAPLLRGEKRAGVTAPQWASVRDMAESASLDDLGVAVFIYIQRCEDERADRRSQ
ncbi:MAG: hypothetical protein AAGA63_14115, partial [Pseudomonadota bacterium]